VSFSTANHERVFSGDSKVIPPFNQSGSLPAGVHRAGISEVEERFGRQSEIRRVQMDSVRWMVELARRAGVLRIVLNGSFVTDIMEPNDVDCVLLMPEEMGGDQVAQAELRGGLPFLEIFIVGQEDFDELVNVTFASDRHGEPKGMIEPVI
jgi:hypothetical protein